MTRAGWVRRSRKLLMMVALVALTLLGSCGEMAMARVSAYCTPSGAMGAHGQEARHDTRGTTAV